MLAITQCVCSLGIQVAARHVPERRGHHPVRLHTRTPPRRPVVAAGHQEFRLDEAQRGAHRLVVRLDHPRPRARAGVDQAFQRHRLRRGKRHVHPGQVLVPAVAQTPQTAVRARHPTLQNPLEALRLHRTAQPERRRAVPFPPAREPVRRIVLRVVTVALEVVDRPRALLHPRDRRDHLAIRRSRRRKAARSFRRGRKAP